MYDQDAMKECGVKHLHAMKLAKYNYDQIQVEYDAASLNAAAATILIDLQKGTAPPPKRSGGYGGGQRPQAGGGGKQCPNCGGPMWDNRQSKRSPKQPDYKCKDRNCDGAIWPPRPREDGPTHDDQYRDDSGDPEGDYGY